MNEYEAQRLENIRRNKALIKELGITQAASPQAAQPRGRSKFAQKLSPTSPSLSSSSQSRKRQRKTFAQPVRASARIATATAQPKYSEADDDELAASATGERRRRRRQESTRASRQRKPDGNAERQEFPAPETALVAAELQASWTSWTAVAGAPTRDPVSFAFHFASHPDFTPNKSPEEMLREGSFGGAYFRPLFSARLGVTVADDWKELPASWIEGLRVDKYLACLSYDPDVNKFKVACGQSIEEWEAAGWINHRYDVRGWFQWYCRFFMGRRCDDDDRQVARWRRCVGGTGRWRRMLLKKYVAMGVKHVFDDGEAGEDTAEVSPVMHQTCHHWAFEVRQDTLERFWKTGT